MRWLDGKSLKQRRVTRAAQLTCKTQYLARRNAFSGPPARRKLLAVRSSSRTITPRMDRGPCSFQKQNWKRVFFPGKSMKLGNGPNGSARRRLDGKMTERQKQRGESLPATHYIL